MSSYPLGIAHTDFIEKLARADFSNMRVSFRTALDELGIDEPDPDDVVFGAYNCEGTKTGRFSSKEGSFNMSNTPKSGPNPALRYVDGRLTVEGQYGPDAWAGTLDYVGPRTLEIGLKPANRRCDGSYDIELKPGTAFGYGIGTKERMFGVFFGTDDEGNVSWLIANDHPEHAVFTAVDVRKEKHQMRLPAMVFTFMHYHGERDYRTPEQKHDQKVTTMIAVALMHHRREEAKPMKMESAHTSRRPVGMYSPAHAHAFEIPEAAPEREEPFCDIGPTVNIEVRHTKGGLDRANRALGAMRTIAARARKGTPWPECGKGEPEALLAEYRLGLRIEDNSSGRLLGIHDTMCSRYDLHFQVFIQARTLAQMLAVIEALPDFK